MCTSPAGCIRAGLDSTSANGNYLWTETSGSEISDFNSMPPAVLYRSNIKQALTGTAHPADAVMRLAQDSGEVQVQMYNVLYGGTAGIFYRLF